MTSNEKIHVIKSPVVPIERQKGELAEAYQYQIIYNVQLADGMIVTKPEDFPKK